MKENVLCRCRLWRTVAVLWWVLTIMDVLCFRQPVASQCPERPSFPPKHAHRDACHMIHPLCMKTEHVYVSDRGQLGAADLSLSWLTPSWKTLAGWELNRQHRKFTLIFDSAVERLCRMLVQPDNPASSDALDGAGVTSCLKKTT